MPRKTRDDARRRNGNLFGVIKLLPGENLMNAVNDETSDVGVPTHRIPEALKIIEPALEPQEYDIVTMGLGLGRERITQDEIAKQLGMDANKVSHIANKAIKKLQKAPYSGKLNKLVPTTAELYKAMEESEDLKQKNSRLQYVSEVQNRTNNSLQNKVEQLEDENRRLMEELEKSREEKQAMENGYSSVVERFNEANREKAALMDALGEAKQKAAALDKIYGVLDEKPTRKECTVAFEDTTAGMTEALCACGIKTLECLVSMNRRALVRLKFRKDQIEKIESCLGEVGLSLRVG